MRKLNVVVLLGLGLATFSAEVLVAQEGTEAEIVRPQSNAPGDREDVGDPTVPSDEILRRIPQKLVPNAEDLLNSAKRLHEAGLTVAAEDRINQLKELDNAPLEIQDEAAIWWASVAPKEVKPAPDKIAEQPKPSMKLPEFKPLPQLPEITIRAMVLSASDKGTALISVADQNISIPLRPVEKQQRMPIPAGQFAEWGVGKKPSTKGDQDTDAINGTGVDEKGGKSKDVEPFEFCLECSFVNEGVVFNVESFSKDSIVLKALPHNKLMIVRVKNSP